LEEFELGLGLGGLSIVYYRINTRLFSVDEIEGH
jgi:hypothetical protein